MIDELSPHLIVAGLSSGMTSWAIYTLMSGRLRGESIPLVFIIGIQSVLLCVYAGMSLPK